MKKVMIILSFCLVIMMVILCIIFYPVIIYSNNLNEAPPKLCADDYSNIITFVGNATTSEDINLIISFINNIEAKKTVNAMKMPLHSPEQQLQFIRRDGTKENLLIWGNNYGDFYLIYGEEIYQIHPFYNFKKKYRQLINQLNS